VVICPLASLRRDAARAVDYVVAASWVLYVDNYLEGLHLPFLHGGLDAGPRLRGLPATRRSSIGTLQVGVAAEGESAFEPGRPRLADHQAPRRRVVVVALAEPDAERLPLGRFGQHRDSRIPDSNPDSVHSYLFPGVVSRSGAGGDLHRVEMEDEAAILSVQRGVASRLWRPRRHLPAREDGVARFHALLGAALGTTWRPAVGVLA
jgi:choline monooxygenase